MGCRAHWEDRIEISLDVILHSKSGTQVHRPEGVILPVNALAVLAEMVGLTRLEEVCETVRGLYDSQAGLHVKGGLQRNPGEYALLVKRLQCCQTINRRSGMHSHLRENDSSRLVSVNLPLPVQ